MLKTAIIKSVREYKGGDQLQCLEIMLAKYDRCIADSEGKTLLMSAASRGFREVVELLIKFQYQTNETDNKGRSALFYAIDSPADNADVVESLVKGQAKLTVND